MGLIACKYFEGTGFVGLRIKERPNKPNVYIRNSSFGGIERVYLWDDVIRYSEGMNEFGVTILSNNFVNEKVSVEYAKKFLTKPNLKVKPQLTELTNNIQIRKALLAQTPQDAINVLIEAESTGVSVVFDAQTCFLLKAIYFESNYYYIVIPITKDDVVLQVLPMAVSRNFDSFHRELRLAIDYQEFFRYLVPEQRTDNTSYESLMIPSKLSVLHRPVNCNTVFSTASNVGIDNKLTLSIVKKEAPFNFLSYINKAV